MSGILQGAGARERVVMPVTLAEREPAPPVPSGELTVEAVPSGQRHAPTPLIRLLMPVVMVAAMAAVVLLMVLSRGQIHPMMLVFPLMMGMGLLMMFVPPQGEDTDENRRTYLRHVQALRDKALENADAQRKHDVHCHPHPDNLWQLVATRRLWERALGDPDALAIRIGTGPTALCTPITVAPSGAPEDLDPVCAVSVRHTMRSIGHVPDLPVVVELTAFGLVALSGPTASGVARALVAQAVFHHGPEAVGIIDATWGLDLPSTGADPGATQESTWRWLKWLPHTRNPDHAAVIIAIIDEQRAVKDADTVLAAAAHLRGRGVVVVVGAQPGSVAERLAQEEGLSLHCDSDLVVHTAVGPETLGAVDLMDQTAALALARRMHGCVRPAELDTPTHTGSSGPVAVPDKGGNLLHLVGIHDPDAIDLVALWAQHARDTQARLRVPIGLGSSGEPVLIDLKESARGGMGPHGLCIGATGSGKSELLRTLVLSLVATHSPEALNLVLVDFKGGATFLGLDELPHTSAVITNLAEEAVLVERMHDALSGEMNRRQDLLRRAGNLANVDEYTAARAQNPALPPLPALVIVVDEFSELLGQHPDFADLFVAIGRLGRSLHMHVLLASQRLEEGRLRGLDSHLSYRIGLKTFSAAESRHVLGVVDAYHLPSAPGVGYIRADIGDAPAGSLSGFRAAYASGGITRTVKPRITEGTHHRKSVFFHSWNDLESLTEVPETTIVVDESVTVIDAVVAAAQRAAETLGQKAHQVWLPPLPARLELAGVADSVGELAASVGMIDRPFYQRQDPLVVSFAQGSGHVAIAGAPRSGKTTFLRTLACSLAATHPPHKIRFYVIDAGGATPTLGDLDALMHLAGRASRKEEEKLRRIIAEVISLIDTADSDPYPGDTFLLIDGWHALSSDFEDLVDQVVRIATDGPSAGVHLVITTTRWMLLRPAIRDLIDTRFELRLTEPLDSLIDRKAQEKIPAHQPGRGIMASAENFMTASIDEGDIAAIVENNRREGHARVPALRLLPEVISVESVSEELRAHTLTAAVLPLGIGGPALCAVGWHPHINHHMVCVGSRGSGRSGFIGLVLEGLTRLSPQEVRVVLIDPRRSHLGVMPDEYLAAYAATTSAMTDVIANTAITLRARLPRADITAEELRARSWWSGPDIVVVIDDEDVVPDGTLTPLIEFLPHGQDIGFHIVVARKSGGIGRALYHPFYSALRDQQPDVFLMDCDKDEGAVLGIKPRPLIPGRAQVIREGTEFGLVHLCRPGKTNEEGTPEHG